MKSLVLIFLIVCGSLQAVDTILSGIAQSYAAEKRDVILRQRAQAQAGEPITVPSHNGLRAVLAW